MKKKFLAVLLATTLAFSSIGGLFPQKLKTVQAEEDGGDDGEEGDAEYEEDDGDDGEIVDAIFEGVNNNGSISLFPDQEYSVSLNGIEQDGYNLSDFDFEWSVYLVDDNEESSASMITEGYTVENNTTINFKFSEEWIYENITENKHVNVSLLGTDYEINEACGYFNIYFCSNVYTLYKPNIRSKMLKEGVDWIPDVINCYVLNADYPDGKTLEFDIDSISSDDEDIVEIYKDGSDYCIEAHEIGTAKICVTYYDENNEEQTIDYAVDVVEHLGYLNFEYYNDLNYLIVGDAIAVETNLTHEWYSEEEGTQSEEVIEYTLEIDEDSYDKDSYEVVINNQYIYITSKGDSGLCAVPVKATFYVDGNEVVVEQKLEINVCESYSYMFCKDIEELALGDSVVLIPESYKVYRDEEGEVVSEQLSNNVYYSVDYDSNKLDVYVGSTLLSPNERSSAVNFGINRKTVEYFSFSIKAELYHPAEYDEAGCEIQSEYYEPIGEKYYNIGEYRPEIYFEGMGESTELFMTNKGTKKVTVCCDNRNLDDNGIEVKYSLQAYSEDDCYDVSEGYTISEDGTSVILDGEKLQELFTDMNANYMSVNATIYYGETCIAEKTLYVYINEEKEIIYEEFADIEELLNNEIYIDKTIDGYIVNEDAPQGEEVEYIVDSVVATDITGKDVCVVKDDGYSSYELVANAVGKANVKVNMHYVLNGKTFTKTVEFTFEAIQETLYAGGTYKYSNGRMLINDQYKIDFTAIYACVFDGYYSENIDPEKLTVKVLDDEADYDENQLIVHAYSDIPSIQVTTKYTTGDFIIPVEVSARVGKEGETEHIVKKKVYIAIEVLTDFYYLENDGLSNISKLKINETQDLDVFLTVESSGEEWGTDSERISTDEYKLSVDYDDSIELYDENGGLIPSESEITNNTIFTVKRIGLNSARLEITAYLFDEDSEEWNYVASVFADMDTLFYNLYPVDLNDGNCEYEIVKYGEKATVSFEGDAERDYDASKLTWECKVYEQDESGKETIIKKGYSISEDGVISLDGKEIFAELKYPEDGNLMVYVYQKCGDVVIAETAFYLSVPHNHVVVDDAAVAATCGKSGLTAGSHCSLCKKIINEQTEVPATGKHTFSSWKVVKPATAVKAGSKVRKCSVCGKIETQITKKLKPTIKVSKSKVTLKRKKSITIKVSKLAKGDKVVSWKSSNKKVATVSKKGKITAKKKGSTVITITLKSGLKKKIKVKVK